MECNGKRTRPGPEVCVDSRADGPGHQAGSLLGSEKAEWQTREVARSHAKAGGGPPHWVHVKYNSVLHRTLPFFGLS